MSFHCPVCVRLSHSIKDYLLTYLLTYYSSLFLYVNIVHFSLYVYFCAASYGAIKTDNGESINATKYPYGRKYATNNKPFLAIFP